MESQESLINKKDLCKISEHFRNLKRSLTLNDLHKILKRATEINIKKESIQLYFNEYFKLKAEKLINEKLNNKTAQADCEDEFSIYSNRIKILREQYRNDNEQYQIKIAVAEGTVLK